MLEMKEMARFPAVLRLHRISECVRDRERTFNPFKVNTWAISQFGLLDAPLRTGVGRSVRSELGLLLRTSRGLGRDTSVFTGRRSLRGAQRPRQLALRRPARGLPVPTPWPAVTGCSDVGHCDRREAALHRGSPVRPPGGRVRSFPCLLAAHTSARRKVCLCLQPFFNPTDLLEEVVGLVLKVGSLAHTSSQTFCPAPRVPAPSGRGLGASTSLSVCSSPTVLFLLLLLLHLSQIQKSIPKIRVREVAAHGLKFIVGCF